MIIVIFNGPNFMQLGHTLFVPPSEETKQSVGPIKIKISFRLKTKTKKIKIKISFRLKTKTKKKTIDKKSGMDH